MDFAQILTAFLIDPLVHREVLQQLRLSVAVRHSTCNRSLHDLVDLTRAEPNQGSGAGLDTSSHQHLNRERLEQECEV